MASLSIEERSFLIEPAQNLSQFSRIISKIIPARYAFAILGCIGIINMFAMRINLSVAIIAMVNSSAIRIISNESLECTEPKTLNSSTSINNDLPPQSDGEFLWDARTQGIILSSFSWCYAVIQLPAGCIVEKYSSKWLYGLGIFFTAILTLLTPVVARMGVGYLIFLRVLEGLGEGVTFPAIHTMLARWSPVHETSRMVSIIFSGPAVGTVIGLSLSAYLCENGFAGGWPSVFYVFGVSGILWFVFWAIFVYDSPETHPWINIEEKEYIEIKRRTRNKNLPPFPWKNALTSTPVLSMAICHFSLAWCYYTMVLDLPTYLKTILHFDMNKNGLLSAFPFLLGSVSSLFGSLLADKLIQKNYLTTLNTRKLFNSIALITPAIFLNLISVAGCDRTLSYIFLVISISVDGLITSGIFCSHIDIAPNYAGTLMSITNTFAAIAAAISPYVVGELTQNKPYRSQWIIVFAITSCITTIGAVSFVIFGDAERQIWDKSIDNKITGVSAM